MNQQSKEKVHLPGSRRQFMKVAAGLPLLGAFPAGLSAMGDREPGPVQRRQVRAALLSATTMPGGQSLGHAYPALRELYEEVTEILLIPFASLPEDRDAYEKRMQRDFAKIRGDLNIRSLHAVAKADAGRVVREAEAFFVSGGNTFLLLRELYDRFVVDLIRERVLNGVPYGGSSAGSNIAGRVIGTTNDFPMTDIPTRRSLGILPAVFNPHHPDPATDGRGYGSRKWKIENYTGYNQEEVVLGVTDPGVVGIRGDQLTLLGEGGKAYLTHRGKQKEVDSAETRDLVAPMTTLRSGV